MPDLDLVETLATAARDAVCRSCAATLGILFAEAAS
jgi:hypothetical protein